jgi:hypothetical protein
MDKTIRAESVLKWVEAEVVRSSFYPASKAGVLGFDSLI